MNLNFPIIFAAALIPLVIGFIYYHPKVFGNFWMKSAKLNEKDLEGGNMALILGLTYLFSLFMCFGIALMTVHQYGTVQALAGEPGIGEAGSAAQNYLDNFMSQYGTRFRTFKHGVLHGVIGSLQFALPVLGINALFERKGAKYILVHLGYWMICFALIAGFLCAYV